MLDAELEAAGARTTGAFCKERTLQGSVDRVLGRLGVPTAGP